MAKVFLDTNVALDIVLKRIPFYKDAVFLLELAADDSIELCISECSLPTIVYTSLESYKAGAKGLKRIIAFVEGCQLLAAPQHIYLQSLGSPFRDKEDVIQYHIALHNRCDYFITRDADSAEFQLSTLPVQSPQQFLKEIEPPAANE